MTVNLTGVGNQQYVTVAVSGVTAEDGGSGGAGTGRVGYLAGDVNQNRVVTVSDRLLINAQVAHKVTASNFLKDVNANGVLTVSDLLLVNRTITNALPPP